MFGEKFLPLILLIVKYFNRSGHWNNSAISALILVFNRDHGLCLRSISGFRSINIRFLIIVVGIFDLVWIFRFKYQVLCLKLLGSQVRKFVETQNISFFSTIIIKSLNFRYIFSKVFKPVCPVANVTIWFFALHHPFCEDSFNILTGNAIWWIV